MVSLYHLPFYAMKYTKIIVSVAIVAGIVALRFTGGMCSLSVSYTMEKLLHESGGALNMSADRSFSAFHDSIVPVICSDLEFRKAKDAKWIEWNNRAIQQQEEKQEQKQQEPDNTKKTGSDY